MEIEPHPDLIKYFETTSEFRSSMKVDDFYTKGEHYNIVSNVESNIFLMRRLESEGLLLETNSVCDCGMGLGNALFDLYLQSNEMDQRFKFTGIEKNSEYVAFVESRLTNLWQGRLNLINGDIMQQDYSKHNIIYSYSPFNNTKMLDAMYTKIRDDIKAGSVLIEHANNGLGSMESLDKISGMIRVKLGHQYAYVKA